MNKTTIDISRMLLQLKLDQEEEEEENDKNSTITTYDDEYLNSELLLKTRNSSTSDSGCSSSASFISQTADPTGSNSLSSSLNSSRLSPIIQNKKQRIISGCSGRAKNDQTLDNNYFQTNNSITSQILNYGDDCAFICTKLIDNLECNNKQLSNKYYFGLADGVSANRLRGYDARLFPSALLDACTHYIDLTSANSALQSTKESNLTNPTMFELIIEPECTEEDEEEWDYEYTEIKQEDYVLEEYIEENDCVNLNLILESAHNLVQENRVFGSSTVCLLSLEFYDLNDYGLLSSCNLGDSGYMLIRDYKVIFKSQSQSHRYNAPFQLGCTPPELLEHDLYRDKPEDSIFQSHQLKPGDFLIISSDGLFDNLYEDEIALIIQTHISDTTASSVSSSSSSNNKVTSEILDSACQILVQKASKAGIKRDDILIMLIYID